MSISIKLLETEAEIEKHINAAISIQINNILSKNSNKLLQDIKSLIPSWINQQPEIQALTSQELIGAFGITISSASIIDAIIGSVVNSTSLSIKKYNNKLQGGGFELNIQPDNFANLLGLPQGHTIYSGGDLHWLDWMLNKGDEIIVVGYQYEPKSGIGRSKLGHMIKGRNFRVPPQYSGTSDNNFITRALSGIEREKEITKLFEKMLGL